MRPAGKINKKVAILTYIVSKYGVETFIHVLARDE